MPIIDPFDKKESGIIDPFDTDVPVEPRVSAKPTQQQLEQPVPEWGRENPNFYGVYGAGKAVAQTGIETVGTTLGAATGAMVPVPGSSLAGAGAGYAVSKRLGQEAFGEDADWSSGAVAKDFAIGAAFQGVGKVLGKIPGVNKIISPEKATVGKEATGQSTLSKALMEKSMKIPPSGKVGFKKIDREVVLKSMLDNKIPISKGGLNRVRDTLDGLLGKMDDVIASNPDAPIKVDSILGPVKEFQAWAENTVSGAKYSRQIQRVIDGFKKQYGDEITLSQAQEIKQTTNAFLRKSYGELKPVVTEAEKQIVRGLKDRIAAEAQEITGVNLKYGEMRQVEAALERAVNRTGNWDWFSLSAGMAGTIVGGTTGKLTSAAEAVAFWRLLKSPYVQSRLAIALRNSGVGGQSNAMVNAITISAYKKAKDYLE